MGIFTKSRPVVTVLRLDGVIQDKDKALSFKNLNTAIEQAFKPANLTAVLLEINSPGGSPAQSDLIARRIRSLGIQRNVPVIAFCEDVAASGGYWLACAAGHIYALHSSIIGSIGVISGGFGFAQAIEKIGVERRVQTAGKSKNLMDPFQAENADGVACIKRIGTEIHGQFIRHVRVARGKRLRDDDDIFTGQIWTGVDAFSLGLIDGLTTLHEYVHEYIGTNTKIIRIKSKRFSLGNLLPFGTSAQPEDFAAALVNAAAAEVDERTLRASVGQVTFS